MKAEGQYTALAAFYDALNAGVDYTAAAGYCDGMVKRFGLPEQRLALDLACGTGNLTLPLAALGYDMLAADRSEAMLGIAAAKPLPDGARVMWLCQDMTAFELYGTVGLIVCALDGINYLTSEAELKRCFSLAHNYLDPGGLFIFDVNTVYKFEHTFASHDYVLEAENVLCAWRNDYSAASRICEFALSIFERRGGVWLRRDEIQRERAWSDRKLRQLLKSAGFELCAVTGGYSESEPRDTDERRCYTARAIK